MSLLSLRIFGAIFVRGCMYILHQKATVMVTNMANNRRAGVRARDIAGF